MSTFTQVLHVSMHTSAFLFTSTKLQLRHLHLFFFFFHFYFLLFIPLHVFGSFSYSLLFRLQFAMLSQSRGGKKHVSPNVSPLSSAANFFKGTVHPKIQIQ